MPSCAIEHLGFARPWLVDISLMITNNHIFYINYELWIYCRVFLYLYQYLNHRSYWRETIWVRVDHFPAGVDNREKDKSNLPNIPWAERRFYSIARLTLDPGAGGDGSDDRHEQRKGGWIWGMINKAIHVGVVPFTMTLRSKTLEFYRIFRVVHLFFPMTLDQPSWISNHLDLIRKALPLTPGGAK